MFPAKLHTTLAVMAATAGLAGAAALADDASAARISTKPTGDASLDDYCRQAADLINQAFAESDRADVNGQYDEGQAWWDHAIDMLQRAQANGCVFSQALTSASSTDTTVVSARPTGNIRLDARCRQWAGQINQAYRDGNPTWAGAIRRGAEQKGCRFVIVHRAGTAASQVSTTGLTRG